MFDATFSDVSGIPSAYFFSVSALDINLWRGIQVSYGDLI